MSVSHCLELLTRWADENICQKVKLKRPGNINDQGYDYELVHPAALTMFVPPEDKLPRGVQTSIPSLCVQLLEGRDLHEKGRAKIRFGLSAWSPGLHGQDVFNPVEGQPGTYKQSTERAFAHDGEGWRDVWNFADVALRALESTSSVGEIRITLEDGIEYGPPTEQGDVLNFYPMWYAWVSFHIEYPIIRNHNYQDLL